MFLIPTIIISIATCVFLILSVLLFPKVKLFGKSVNTYWIICLFGAIFILLFQGISLEEAFGGLTSDSDINPLKILVLFISMTFLSVFLDELGFFKYLATLATKKSKTNQLTLFFVLYALISVLTIFTSNDIVILTFTPFICYFAKNTKIDPIPYLVAEFAAANTWSMMLIVGNPTNVYLATAAGIDFISYFKVMAFPTLLSGLTEIAVIYLLFRKKLKEPLNAEIAEEKISDKPSLIVGLAHLGICLVLLTVSSYVGFDMWLICLLCAVSLILCAVIIALTKKTPPTILKNTAKRLPWDLIPFVISMFILVLALEKQQITDVLRGFLGEENVIFSYGISSFLACNLINNIPMSVLFSTLPNMADPILTYQAIYSTIVGSNIGAFLTPIGALAGIMFTDLINKQNVKYSFKSFVLYGTVISIPTLLMALVGLIIVL